jgi:hypothetical protein
MSRRPKPKHNLLTDHSHGQNAPRQRSRLAVKDSSMLSR